MIEVAHRVGQEGIIGKEIVAAALLSAHVSHTLHSLRVLVSGSAFILISIASTILQKCAVAVTISSMEMETSFCWNSSDAIRR